MNSRKLRRLGVGATLTVVGGLSVGVVDAPAHAATATSWTDLANAINNATGAVTVQLVTSITQPTGAPDLAVKPGAIITLDLHHNGLTATAQQPGHAGIGLPVGAKLIVENTGPGAPGVLIATGSTGDPTTGTGAGAGIGGNGDTGAGDAAGTLLVLGGIVTANGGAATPAGLGGAGAGVGGGGGGGTGAANGATGGQNGFVAVTAGTLNANGGAGHNGGAGAGIGGGGGSAGGTHLGGTGGNDNANNPAQSIPLMVTDTGIVHGAGGSVTGADQAGAGAGVGGGGGGTGAPGGKGGAATPLAFAVEILGHGTLVGTGGTATQGGGGAGAGGGGGAAPAGAGGAAFATVNVSAGATYTTSGAGSSNSGGGGAKFGVSATTFPAGWDLSLTDTADGRAPLGGNYAYVINPRLQFEPNVFSEYSGNTFTVSLALPLGVSTSGATGERWACSAGPHTVTCSWSGGGSVNDGLPLPITVPVTLDHAVPPGVVLTATATLTSGDLPTAVTRSDTVTVTRHHHRHGWRA